MPKYKSLPCTPEAVKALVHLSHHFKHEWLDLYAEALGVNQYRAMTNLIEHAKERGWLEEVCKVASDFAIESGKGDKVYTFPVWSETQPAIEHRTENKALGWTIYPYGSVTLRGWREGGEANHSFQITLEPSTTGGTWKLYTAEAYGEVEALDAPAPKGKVHLSYTWEILKVAATALGVDIGAYPDASPTFGQPKPQPGKGDVWMDLMGTGIMSPRLKELASKRREFGVKKYGTPLQYFNGRDARGDAREEVLDLMAYLYQAYVEFAEAKDVLKAFECGAALKAILPVAEFLSTVNHNDTPNQKERA